MKKFFYLSIATGLGSGLVPFAPGTFGSILGVLVTYFLFHLPLEFIISFFVVFFIISWWCTKKAGLHYEEVDCKKIVCDEILGQIIALAPLYYFGLFPQWLILGFAFFRAFDILKPFPISWCDKQKTAFFVIADDLLAGLFAALILYCVIVLF